VDKEEEKSLEQNENIKKPLTSKRRTELRRPKERGTGKKSAAKGDALTKRVGENRFAPFSAFASLRGAEKKARATRKAAEKIHIKNREDFVLGNPG